MATFKTQVPDIHELKLDFGFALLLYDGFTRSQQLVGQITVRLKDKPTIKPFTPFEKTAEATFLFFGLPPGDYTVQVRSNERTPEARPAYYLPADIPITIPMPHVLWPAFPDITLADQDKLPDDPGQPAAYRAQRKAATLQPSTAYPFPAGATLVRGKVLAAGVPLLDAVVTDSNQLNYQTGTYRTGSDGEFVLFFENVSGAIDTTITLLATHEARPNKRTDVKVRRGITAVTNIEMAP
jgi:hypothetical protein